MNFNKLLLHCILPILSFFLLLLLVSVTSCKRQSPQSKAGDTFAAQITFNDSVHDFGIFSSDSPTQQYVFNFVNSGNVPVVILKVDPSCRCTSVKYTQEPIQPGKSGKVKVTFDGTKSAIGYFDKSIRVRINSSYIYLLRIKGCMKQYEKD